MKCPRCGSNMVEKPPSVIYPTDPPQYVSIMWCGCGYSESLGRIYDGHPYEILMDDWLKANGK